MAVSMWCVLPGPVYGVTQLKAGDEAPNFELANADGAVINNESLRDHAVVLVFGEIYHSKTIEACRVIEDALAGEQLRGQQVETLLIVTKKEQGGTDGRVAAAPDKMGVLYDLDREAFGAYHVTVLPSVVVIDARGRVAHSIAALIPDFSDRLSDAVLLALGRLTQEQFDARRHAQAGTGLTEDQAQARRLTMLAGQLSARGLVPLAEQKYAESLALDPEQTDAWVGMGRLKLRRGKLAEAEQQFQKALEVAPESADAAIGLAFVMTRRGGDELAEAERLVRGVLSRDPAQPRAHYLMGLIKEQGGDSEAAAASFKKAAELLLDYYELEPTP